MSSDDAEEQVLEVKLAIGGMTCADCASLVESTVRKLAGVRDMSVSAMTGQATFILDIGLQLDAELLQTTVRNLGFTSKLTSCKRMLVSDLAVSVPQPVKVCFSLPSCDPSSQDAMCALLLKMEGITTASMVSKTECLVEYEPAAVGARQISEIVSRFDQFARVIPYNAKTGDTSSLLALWRGRLIFALCFCVPIIVLSFIIPASSAATQLDVKTIGDMTLKTLLLWLLATPVLAVVCRPLYVSAYKAAVYGRTCNIDTLIVLSTTIAYAYSVVIAFLSMSGTHYSSDSFFDTSALILLLIALGRYMETMAKGKAANALMLLSELQEDEALLISSVEPSSSTSSGCVDVSKAVVDSCCDTKKPGTCSSKAATTEDTKPSCSGTNPTKPVGCCPTPATKSCCTKSTASSDAAPLVTLSTSLSGVPDAKVCLSNAVITSALITDSTPTCSSKKPAPCCSSLSSSSSEVAQSGDLKKPCADKLASGCASMPTPSVPSTSDALPIKDKCCASKAPASESKDPEPQESSGTCCSKTSCDKPTPTIVLGNLVDLDVSTPDAPTSATCESKSIEPSSRCCDKKKPNGCSNGQAPAESSAALSTLTSKSCGSKPKLDCCSKVPDPAATASAKSCGSQANQSQPATSCSKNTVQKDKCCDSTPLASTADKKCSSSSKDTDSTKIASAIAKNSCCSTKSSGADQCSKQLPAFNLESQGTKTSAYLLQRHDIIKVFPGGRIPTDGIVVCGDSAVNESMVTGEARPVKKGVGSDVFAGTLNVDGALLIDVSRIPGENTLNGILSLVQEAQASKPAIQKLADRFAALFVPVILLLAVFAFVIWLALGLTGTVSTDGLSPLAFALRFAMATLIVSCPCAVGLAVPTAVVVASGVGAKLGILFKSGPALETAHKVDTVMFDKTGTLTHASMHVVAAKIVDPSYSESRFWNLVVACESSSDHPIAKTLVQHAEQYVSSISDARELLPIDSSSLVSGRGIECTTDDSVIHIGNSSWMTDNQVSLTRGQQAHVILAGSSPTSQLNDTLIDSSADTAWQNMASEAPPQATQLFVAVDRRLVAWIAIADKIRSESFDIVRMLQEKGIDVWVISGDSPQATRAVAQQLGIPASNAHGGLLPAHKIKFVKQQQAAGHTVAMIGDGINDSPALSAANVGIAVAKGSFIAFDSADVVLMKDDLALIPILLELSHATYNRIKLNFLWAFLYNLIAIPFATGILFPATGLSIPPAFAGLSELLSSLPVVLFSILLRRFKPSSGVADASWRSQGEIVIDGNETAVQLEAMPLLNQMD